MSSSAAVVLNPAGGRFATWHDVALDRREEFHEPAHHRRIQGRPSGYIGNDGMLARAMATQFPFQQGLHQERRRRSTR